VKHFYVNLGQKIILEVQNFNLQLPRNQRPKTAKVKDDEFQNFSRRRRRSRLQNFGFLETKGNKKIVTPIQRSDIFVIFQY
jgi:hypothetical protein